MVRRILDRLDNLDIAREVRRRDAADTGERMTLEELIAAQGYDPDEIHPYRQEREGEPVKHRKTNAVRGRGKR